MIFEIESVANLERFNDGIGGRLPRLAAVENMPGHVKITAANRHRYKADLATTCVIHALRRAVELQERTSLAILKAAFERRSGLYFASPYLTHRSFVLAIRTDPDLSDLRTRLLQELLASLRSDSFIGRHNTALSTPLAILVLAALGCRGCLLHYTQIRSLELVDDLGQWPASTPFNSTLPIPDGSVSHGGAIHCGDQRHALTLYEDGFRMIGTALAVPALGGFADRKLRDLPNAVEQEQAHGRYRCTSLADYVARFALPPYLEALSPAA